MFRILLIRLRSSMSAKIALIVTLPVVLVTSLFSYHHNEYERNTLFRNAEIQLLRVGENLKDPAEAFLQKQDFLALQEIVEKAALGSDIGIITVINNRKRVVSCSKKKWLGADLNRMHPEEFTVEDLAAAQKAFGGGYSSYYDEEDSQVCLVMPLAFSESSTGVLFITLDARSTNVEIRKRAIENFGVAILSALLIGVSIYFLFHGLFTKRLRSVANAAVRLTTGDLSARANDAGTDEISYLATSFNLLGEEITNWRNHLEEMAANRLKDLTVLYEVVETTSSSLELGRVLPDVLERVLGSLGTDKGVVVLVGNGKTLMLMGHRGLSEEGLCQIIEHGKGGTGDVILMNNALLVSGDESAAEEAFIPGLEQDSVRSALVVPVSVRGRAIGAFAVYSEKRSRFTDHDESLLTTVGNQLGVAVENARLYEKTLELAQMDGLTGVANRRYLMERLEQEIYRADRYHTSLSIGIMDLDKFKSFNDTYGHLKGDELLKSFSAMVQKAIRSSDIVGRYGGEEFCIILPNTSIKGALVIAERIRAAAEELRVPLGSGADFAGRTVSIGLAEHGSGKSMENMLASADAALYRAKETGRNRVVCPDTPDPSL